MEGAGRGLPGEWAFFVVREALSAKKTVEHVIDFYTYAPAAGGGQAAITLVTTVGLGANALPYIFSAESFNSASYVFMERNAATSIPDELNVESQIWVVSMDGSINEEISDSSRPGIVRSDPELFPLPSGPVIDYNEYPAGTNSMTPPFQGVWLSPIPGITP